LLQQMLCGGAQVPSRQHVAWARGQHAPSPQLVSVGPHCLTPPTQAASVAAHPPELQQIGVAGGQVTPPPQQVVPAGRHWSSQHTPPQG
jgi:hypothetical protein